MSNAASLETLFFAALEKETADERAAYLAEACGSDVELRRQVEKMLHALPRMGDFLQQPLVEPEEIDPADATQAINPSCVGPNSLPLHQHVNALERTEGGQLDNQDATLDFLQPTTRPNSLGQLKHYEMLDVLGRGGFGIVFRAFDEILQRVVAVKVLAPQLAVTSPARKRFLREARSSAKMRHANVVQVYAVEEQPLPYLVMEFIPGETLQQRLDRAGPLEPMEVVQIGRQIAEGLAAAHSTGLIHRDIKPGNILIEADSQQHVKITDFGLARAADDASLTQSGYLAGTPLFMAPEQALGEALDHRADLFSLGSVLYTMCSGRPPFRAKGTLAVLKRVTEDTPRPIKDIIPEVPQWLCDLISRLHAKKPQDRIATAREVADLLARGLETLHRPGTAPVLPEVVPANVSTTPEAMPPLKPLRFRAFSWLVAASVLLLLCGGVSFTEATGDSAVRSTVLRLFSPQGTLVVEADDPGVSVQIDGEGHLIVTGAGPNEIRLKPGKYTVEARKGGQLVSRELVTVSKNGRQVVRITQEPLPPATKQDTEKQQDPDRRAAEYVLSLGGTVRLNEVDADITNATDLPSEPFRLTAVILFHNKEVTDASLAHFKDCKHLLKLNVHHTQVSDAGLAHVKECTSLTHLLLAGTQVSDMGLAHVKDLKKLTHLNLGHTQNMSNAGLVHLKGCTNLTHLWLNESQVGNAGLAHLKECTSLTFLMLQRCEQVSDAGLAHLKECKSLTTLILDMTDVTATGLAELQQALPQCKIE